MKLNAAVTHVSLLTHLNYKGRSYTKTLFDNVSSMPGIKMQLCAYGVLCRKDQEAFIVPFAQCASIAVVDEDEVKKK